MKTDEDSYTITIKQIVRFQERIHFEKFQLDQVKNGHLSAIIHSHMAVIQITIKIIKMVNHARWLDHYYKTKCVISGEDAS